MNPPKIYSKKSAFKKAIGLFSKREKNRLRWLLTLQVLLGILDIVGVALFGLVGALAVAGVRFNQPDSSLQNLLSILHLENLEFQAQVAVLGVSAAIILIAKTAFSVFLSRKTMSFLGNRGADLSTNLMSKLLNTNLFEIKRDSIQAITYKLTGGVESITVGIVGSSIGLVVDGSLLLMMVLLLTLVQPATAFATFSFFVVISVTTYLFLNKRSINLAKASTDTSIEIDLQVNQILNSYREITVKNIRYQFLNQFQELRRQASHLSAESQFLPNVSKYIMETSVVVGALLVAGVQFLVSDANKSISSLAIFIMSSSRIAPAVLRVQQNAINLKSSLGKSILTFDLIERFENINPLKKIQQSNPILQEDFTAEILVENLSFTYPGNNYASVKNISFSIKQGMFVAIVGPSGSGKSTLVDCVLGLQKLDSGSVSISNLAPREAFQMWPSEISYVPQEVPLFFGSIRSNIAIGVPESDIDDLAVLNAINQAQLNELVVDGQQSLENVIGAGGTLLSGGQRQRLGIARALYSKPSLLFMDEATSSLDGNTEAGISSQLTALKGKITIIMIAHRLSTIRSADLIFYLENGEIAASGSFEDVRSKVPGFDSAANIMGL